MKRMIRQQTGYTLFELLLALGCGLLLITSCLTLYLTSLRNQHGQQTLQQIQSDAQMSSAIINAEIALAGYIGCARLTNDFPIINHTSRIFTANNKIQATNDHELIMQHMEFPSGQLTAVTQGNVIMVGRVPQFKASELIMIADCQHLEIQTILKVEKIKDKQVIYLAAAINAPFAVNANVGHLVITKFFVVEANRKDSNNKPVHSLIMQNLLGGKVELTDMIGDMVFKYSLVQQDRLFDVNYTALQEASAVRGIAYTMRFAKTTAWHGYQALI